MEKNIHQIVRHSKSAWSWLRKRPPKSFFAPLETRYSSSGPVAILFYLQCTNCTLVCDQIANKSYSLFCFTKCKHFEEISRKTIFAICKFLAIYRTVIIAFSIKRCCSKSALLKLVLSVQIFGFISSY